MLDWKQQLDALKSELPKGEELQTTENENVVKIQKEPLRIELDKRKGKTATLITNFQGDEESLKELATILKKKCSAGGSARDGEILIQGDFRTRISDILTDLNYKVKKLK